MYGIMKLKTFRYIYMMAYPWVEICADLSYYKQGYNAKN